MILPLSLFTIVPFILNIVCNPRKHDEILSYILDLVCTKLPKEFLESSEEYKQTKNKELDGILLKYSRISKNEEEGFMYTSRFPISKEYINLL